MLEIEWWKRNIFNTFKSIRYPKITKTIYTDASLVGWGASYNNKSTGGAWLPDEKQLHINILELKAIFFALRTFCKEEKFGNEHIKILSDNTTAISCINKMGTSHSLGCHYQTVQIWELAYLRNIHLTAAFIPGIQNTVADRESRAGHIDGEWMLLPKYLHLSLELLKFEPNIDLFATQINRQFGNYVAFKPDPEAKYIDAFTIDWFGRKFYAFPPVCIIPRVLEKIRQDEAEGILVVPFWPNQVWYPVMLKMLISVPILLNSRKTLLQLPQSPGEVHPMLRKMDIIVAHLSGLPQDAQICQKRLLKSYHPHGEKGRRRGTTAISKNLLNLVLRGTKIPFKQPLKPELNF